MSFNLFGKKKEDTDHKDTSEIKKAAISDTQQSNVSQENVTQMQQEPQSNFVNPFSQNNSSNFQTPQEFDATIANNNLDQAMGNQNNLNAYGQGGGNSQPGFNQGNASGAGANPFASEQASNTPVNTGAMGNDMNQQQNMGGVQQQQPAQQNNGNVVDNPTNPALQQKVNMGAQGGVIDQAHIQELIDETVEKILDERWTDMTNNINKVLTWKTKIEEDLKHLESGIVDLNDGFRDLEKKILSKVSSYDKNILDVNSEIKALEKVFQKITPTLINNVNQLSKIASDIKGEGGKTKPASEFVIDEKDDADDEKKSDNK